MGTRLITDAARLAFRGDHIGGYTGAPSSRSGASGRSQSPLSGNFRMSVLYDGTIGKQGLPEALGPNELWLDASGLYRANNNFGPTLQNMGATICQIDVCQGPRSYAYNTTAAQVTELLNVWEPLVTLGLTEKHVVSGIYSLFRFTFTVNAALNGAVECLSG